MYRLFVAIDLPEEVKKEVAGIAGKLQGGRWVPDSQLHLTLRFIGEADEALFRAIKAALAGVRGTPFPLALKGVGHFPPGRYPRVLWVGMEESTPLMELQRRVESALADAGVPPEGRRFSPHITLARLKDTAAAAVAAFEERFSAFRTAPFPAGEFHLYSSTLTRDGAIHTREASYSLTEGD
jgi:2'-5' RNA ligase